MTKGIIYYSDLRGDQVVLRAVREQLARATALPIVSHTLNQLASWSRPVQQIVTTADRGYLTMFRQILDALELSTADVIFHCEHDVLYHPSHFSFTPAQMDRFYYNQHTWRIDAATGRALFYFCNQVSGLCASRELLIDHYRKVVADIEQHGFDRSLGFEPGGNRKQQQLNPRLVETWMSEQPNVDIKTDFCLTKGRWSQDQFRNKATCQGWTESDRVPGWGVTLGRFSEFLAGLPPAPVGAV